MMRPTDQQGANVIEFALVAMVLLLVLGGVLDLGRTFNNFIASRNGAREGARYGSRYPWDLTGIQTRVNAENVGNGVTITSITAECYSYGTTPTPLATHCGYMTTDGAGNKIVVNPPPPGSAIRVSVTYQFNTMLADLLGMNTMNLNSSAEMIIFAVNPNP